MGLRPRQIARSNDLHVLIQLDGVEQPISIGELLGMVGYKVLARRVLRTLAIASPDVICLVVATESSVDDLQRTTSDKISDAGRLALTMVCVWKFLPTSQPPFDLSKSPIGVPQELGLGEPLVMSDGIDARGQCHILIALEVRSVA